MVKSMSVYSERFTGPALIEYWGQIKAHVSRTKYSWLTFLATLALLNQYIYFGIAVDRSLPGDSFYVVTKWDKNVGRRDKVAFHSAGGHVGPPAGIVLMKYVKGVPGDVITVGGESGRDVFVNGEWVAYAKPKSRDLKPLTLIQPGVVPDGHIFVVNPTIDSFDSRYAEVGFIAKERLIGRALTLF
jgi:conjugal transfer pilin signal peptidase TrbI